MTTLAYHYINRAEFDEFCNDLLRLGERNHENLEIKIITRNGRTYHTIKTCCSSSSAVDERGLESQAALICQLFQENKVYFAQVGGDLPTEFIGKVETHFESAAVSRQYFERAKNEAEEVQAASRKKLEELKIANRMSLGRSERVQNIVQSLFEDKETFALRFICDKYETLTDSQKNQLVVPQATLFKNLGKEGKLSFIDAALDFEKQQGSKSSNEIVLKNFSFEAVEYFVKHQYQLVTEKPLPLSLLIEIESLAEFVGDDVLSKICKRAINHWKRYPEYPWLFVDLLNNRDVESHSEIYTEIPFSTFQYANNIRPKNLEIITNNQIECNVFGSEAWQTHLGVDVGEEPPIPPEALELVKKNWELFLIPVEIDGKPLDVDLMEEIMLSDYLNDKKTGYKEFSPELRRQLKGQNLWKEKYWVALKPGGLIKGSMRKGLQQTKELIEQLGPEYAFPEVLEAIIVAFLMYARCKDVLQTGNDFRQLPLGLGCRTRCGDGGKIVGNLSREGLSVKGSGYGAHGLSVFGVVGFQRFLNSCASPAE